jgi:hypothetical protein
MAREDPERITGDDFVAIPRLEEYYRPRARLVGWGHDIPKGWRRAKHLAKSGLTIGSAIGFFAVVLLNPPAVF